MRILKSLCSCLIPALLVSAIAGCGGGGAGSPGANGPQSGPSNASVTINDGDASTSSMAVTLSLSAADTVSIIGYYASESSAAPEATASGWTEVTAGASYSGTVDFTLSSAPGDKTVYVWFKDEDGGVSASASDNIIFDPSRVSGLAGTWGYQVIRHDSAGGWFVELSKSVFNLDGTGYITGYWNNNGTLGSGTKSFIYSTAANQDGSFTMTIDSGGTVSSAKWAASDDGNMIVVDGTGMFGPATQGLMALVKLDGTAVFTNEDFNGEYYTIGYGCKTAEGTYRATSTMSTADGAGSLNVHGTRNTNGAVDASSAMVTYGVQGDKINLSNGSGLIISGDNSLAVVADAFNSYDYESGFFMKRGSGYLTPSIGGTWAIAGMGDDDGTSFTASFGTMTCDAVGTCALSLKNQTDGAVVNEASSMNIAVDSDGSFGVFLSADAPAYAGAIGNNGNTVMFNMSFDGAAPGHREIFLGVRCTQCADLSAL